MPQTAQWAIPYPALADAPNGPAQMQSLAERTDALISTGVQSVSSTAVITTPVTNQLVYDLSVNILKRWSGSAWLDVIPGAGPDTAHRHEVDFTSSGQVIPTNTWRSLGWNTVGVGCNDVTLATGGLGTIAAAVLTFVRGGLWQVNVDAHTYNGDVAAFRLMDPAASGAVLIGDGSNTTFSGSACLRIAAGTQLAVHVIQQSGGTTVARGHLTAAWLRG